MVSEEILWKQKKLSHKCEYSEDIYSKKKPAKKWFLDGEWGHSVEAKNSLYWMKKNTYGEWGHIMQKKTLWMWMKKNLWYKNGEWGRDMIKKIRLEKIRIVMVSEDIINVEKE